MGNNIRVETLQDIEAALRRAQAERAAAVRAMAIEVPARIKRWAARLALRLCGLRLSPTISRGRP